MFKKSLYVICLSIASFGLCQPKLELIGFDAFQKKISKANDTLYVVNFWATWCKPCVKELPHFFEAVSQRKEQKISFIFMSLDFPKNQNRVAQFLKDNDAKGTHWLLNEKDPNDWIDKVKPTWQGNIPATWVIRNNKTQAFTPEELTSSELNNLLNLNLNK